MLHQDALLHQEPLPTPIPRASPLGHLPRLFQQGWEQCSQDIEHQETPEGPQ